MAGGYTGGYNGVLISSTEIYEAGQWTEVGALPAAVTGVRGASVQNTVYMMGKRIVVTHMLLILNTNDALIGGNDGSAYRDDIWKYDADTQKWVEDGQMSEGRRYHAVSTVANKDLAKYCNS